VEIPKCTRGHDLVGDNVFTVGGRLCCKRCRSESQKGRAKKGRAEAATSGKIYADMTHVYNSHGNSARVKKFTARQKRWHKVWEEDPLKFIAALQKAEQSVDKRSGDGKLDAEAAKAIEEVEIVLGEIRGAL